MKMRFDIPEVDYPTLLQALSGYARPRDRITRLLRSGELVRIKKGLYVTEDPRDWYSREVLANLIYGPSCVSLEFALGYHGLIPEAVETVTSVTTARRKRFNTPAGRFEYEHLPESWYSFGVLYETVDPRRGFLIASPEKALADTLYLRTPDIGRGDIEGHLFENLRIDPEDFARLDFSALESSLKDCPRTSVRALAWFASKGAGG